MFCFVGDEFFNFKFVAVPFWKRKPEHGRERSHTTQTMRSFLVSSESHGSFLFPQPLLSSNSIATTHSSFFFCHHPFHFKPPHPLFDPKPHSLRFRSFLHTASKSDSTAFDDNDGDGNLLVEEGDGVEEALVEDGVYIEVTKLDKNSCRIQSRISIDASLSSIWSILTDYERLADFIPGLAVSQLLQKGHNYARLLQVFPSHSSYAPNGVLKVCFFIP